MAIDTSRRVRAASLAEVEAAGRLVVALDGSTVCLIADGGDVFAVDNRCPHMGFPLHRGSVSDGILTCHWHHARFDLCSGGTFDQWADELRRFPVEVRGDDVLVDVRAVEPPRRLLFGVERRGGGWGRGLTTLACLGNLARAHPDGDERAAALFHGVADVAAD